MSWRFGDFELDPATRAFLLLRNGQSSLRDEVLEEFEALSVIIQVGSYKMRKKRVFRMAPIHHHYELKGWAENKIVVRFWIAAALCALLGTASLKLNVNEELPGRPASVTAVDASGATGVSPVRSCQSVIVLSDAHFTNNPARTPWILGATDQ